MSPTRAVSDVAIGTRIVGVGRNPYVIAEMSGNHNGDIGRAFALIDAAHEAGADAVKLQTYRADTITIDHDGPGFRIEGGLWHGKRLYDLYDEAHTPWDWHERLFAHAHGLNIDVFSSPFDDTAVDFLDELGVPAFKVASFEAVDLPLIRKIASKGKPIIISTGIADVREIEAAVSAAADEGANDIMLLHCVSGYPAPFADMNLRTIPDMQERFGRIVGLSDHTMGVGIPVAAVALGASVIEKHMTLRRSDGGPDAAFSLEPDEFGAMVTAVRQAWEALGAASYERKSSEKGNAAFRRSLYAVADIGPGDVLTDHNIRSIRPGFGLPPAMLPELIGRKARFAIARGTPLSLDLIE